jgi:hypothetical protein
MALNGDSRHRGCIFDDARVRPQLYRAAVRTVLHIDPVCRVAAEKTMRIGSPRDIPWSEKAGYDHTVDIWRRVGHGHIDRSNPEARVRKDPEDVGVSHVGGGDEATG